MRRPPAAFRAPRLLALGAAAALVAAAVAAATASLGVTTASFTDRITSTAGLEADTLPAPEGVTATLTGDLESVSVTWDTVPGDFADSWDVARLEGACSGWTPPTGGGVTSEVTLPHTDNSVADGETYCYAVRGTYENWTSAYSAVGPATEVRVPAISRLYPSSGGTLQSTAGAGTQSFGCDVLGLLGLVCTTLYPNTYTFSAAGIEVLSSQDWLASLRFTSGIAVSLGTQTIGVSVWYASGVCGAVPTAQSPNAVASGSVQFASPLVIPLDETVLVPLTANPALVLPGDERTLCVNVRAVGGAVLELLTSYDLTDGADTWIEGRFE